MIAVSLRYQQQVLAALNRLAADMVDFTRIAEPVEEALHEDERGWLDSEGQGSFAPLTDDYAERKAKTHPGKKILQREGNLYRALTEKGGDSYFIARKESIAFGAEGRAGEILVYHQAGTSKMVAREALHLTDEGALKLAGIVLDEGIGSYARELGFEVHT